MFLCRFYQSSFATKSGQATCTTRSTSVTFLPLMWPSVTLTRSASVGGQAASAVSLHKHNHTMMYQISRWASLDCVHIHVGFALFIAFICAWQLWSALLVKSINRAWTHARRWRVKIEIIMKRASVHPFERSVCVRAAPSCTEPTLRSVSLRTSVVRY